MSAEIAAVPRRQRRRLFDVRAIKNRGGSFDIVLRVDESCCESDWAERRAQSTADSPEALAWAVVRSIKERGPEYLVALRDEIDDVLGRRR